MDYNTDGARQGLINAFGESLGADENFVVCSPKSYRYNCIAFAMGMDDRWVDHSDLPWHWWPPIEKGDTIEHLKGAFRYFGFEDCPLDDKVEEVFDKIVIYQKDDKWTHAARLVADGVCHSKFGESYDGQHSGGDTLMSVYGTVCAMMRRLKANSHLTEERKGMPPGVMHLNIKVRINGELNHLVAYNGKTYLAGHGLEVKIGPDGIIEAV